MIFEDVVSVSIIKRSFWSLPQKWHASKLCRLYFIPIFTNRNIDITTK
uniref:Uncharacterized protein n=1 Tax=Arundo donax TaxID=35708 RepID=A0A0A9B7R3_ARUDO